jgi:hypothetical protein
LSAFFSGASNVLSTLVPCLEYDWDILIKHR